MNPYDNFIANKVINGHQCTITWYVDGNQISHVDEEVSKEIMQKLEKKSGKFKITTEKEHKFLGMEIIFTDNGTVKVRTKDTLQSAIDVFGESADFKVTSPAAKHLFEINPNSNRLGTKKVKHSIQ